MNETHNQLRLVVFPVICRFFCIPGGDRSPDFWTINRISPKDFVFYAVVVAMVSMDRPTVREQLVTSPEVWGKGMEEGRNHFPIDILINEILYNIPIIIQWSSNYIQLHHTFPLYHLKFCITLYPMMISGIDKSSDVGIPVSFVLESWKISAGKAQSGIWSVFLRQLSRQSRWTRYILTGYSNSRWCNVQDRCSVSSRRHLNCRHS